MVIERLLKSPEWAEVMKVLDNEIEILQNQICAPLGAQGDDVKRINYISELEGLRRAKRALYAHASVPFPSEASSEQSTAGIPRPESATASHKGTR